MTTSTPPDDRDPMPVFPLKAKDRLALRAIRAYERDCRAIGLEWHADEVLKAIAEIEAWQKRHPDLVKLPDHVHVPAAGASS